MQELSGPSVPGKQRKVVGQNRQEKGHVKPESGSESDPQVEKIGK